MRSGSTKKGRGDPDDRERPLLVFYAGQLRYRIRLACHPDLPPDTEPALFASLQEEVGRPINEYTGADPDAWAAVIERARATGDAPTRNGYEPKAPCQAQIADQRAGMSELIAHIRANKGPDSRPAPRATARPTPLMT